jgi:hypothetical protein
MLKEEGLSSNFQRETLFLGPSPYFSKHSNFQIFLRNFQVNFLKMPPVGKVLVGKIVPLMFHLRPQVKISILKSSKNSFSLNDKLYKHLKRKMHRDRTRASTLCWFCLIFSSFEHAKNLPIMGPDNTKNSSKSVIFSYLTMNNIIVRILLLL